MRIISGYFKGKKINQPIDIITRPLKDLVKESIFNIINHSKKFDLNLQDSNILDLFSGVGSFGIECLSRGTKKVIFVENYKEVLPILKKNLTSLKSLKNYEVINEDIFRSNFLMNFKIKFNIIFLDPPFKDNNLDKIFLKIREANILNNDGIIILHRHKKEKNLSLLKFKIIEEKIYGNSKIFFLSKSN
tara:strand:- start:95 stop:661 length:567 start_codon:yes stop_codon:yes gene_type:complete